MRAGLATRPVSKRAIEADGVHRASLRLARVRESIGEIKLHGRLVPLD
jgi:hypothetical protein